MPTYLIFITGADHVFMLDTKPIAISNLSASVQYSHYHIGCQTWVERTSRGFTVL